MKNKIAHWQGATLLAAGISMSMISTLHAAAPVLYELHSTGSVWGYTGVPCNGKVCSGWEMLDDETTTIQIAAGNGTLYQRHTDGSVWQWTGAVCNGNACNRWTQIGSNAANILAAGSNVYLYNQNGLYQFNGEPCTNPSTCPGWIGIDYDPYAEAYYAKTILWLRSMPTGRTSPMNFSNTLVTIDIALVGCYSAASLSALGHPSPWLRGSWLRTK
jgi:hypothetical protein